MNDYISPVSPQERISALDMLRGAAVLGILLMNIMAFGLPMAAYLNPSVAGGAEGPNLAFWFVNQVLFEGKMRAIFSMLFGAGSLLLLTRAEERGAGLFAADIYYRRTLWLVVIGLIHAYLVWSGDILFFYGVVGLTLLPFRRMSARGLLVFGCSIFLVLSLMTAGVSSEFTELKSKAEQAQAGRKAGKELTADEEESIRGWEGFLKENKPDQKTVDKEIQDHRAGYLANLKLRAGQVVTMHTVFFYRYIGFDVAGAFLIGIALLKLGVLSAQRGSAFYARLMLFGYGLGLPLNAFTGWMWMQSGWDPIAMFRYIYSGLEFGRLLVALGHISVLMLLYKAGLFRFLTRRLAAAGQMALTNYLTQSAVCTILFNGYGFGLFGKLERIQLLYVVFAVWLFQLIVSPIWLGRFRYGPLEWAWRSLTYWEKQPMRLRESTPAGEAAPATA